MESSHDRKKIKKLKATMKKSNIFDRSHTLNMSQN